MKEKYSLGKLFCRHDLSCKRHLIKIAVWVRETRKANAFGSVDWYTALRQPVMRGINHPSLTKGTLDVFFLSERWLSIFVVIRDRNNTSFPRIPEIALEFADIIAELCLGQFRGPLLGMEWIEIERGALRETG